jgi:hypothetical protein
MITNDWFSTAIAGLVLYIFIGIIYYEQRDYPWYSIFTWGWITLKQIFNRG